MSTSNLCAQIIEKNSIHIYMQTILSHHNSFALGIEAFVKASHPTTGELINPYNLFKLADSENLSVELNLLIVKEAIEAFLPIYAKEPHSLLFINISESIIQFKDPNDLILSIVKQSGLSPSKIVFDIADYENATINEILSFINNYRQHGFYISIDDIGKNYFNLDRILLLNPDIIKINHQHMERLNQPDYTLRVQTHIGKIAHELGIIVVETGIENDEELLYAYEQGAQFFQGYYIHKPVEVSSENLDDFLDLDDTFALVRKYRQEAVIEEMRPFMNKMVGFLNEIRNDSHQWESEHLNIHIDKLFLAHPSIENGWLLDHFGIQISKTMINNKGFSIRNAAIFNIYDMGHDYSKNDFFSLLTSGALEIWITKPYRSLLSNTICVTTSSYIEIDGQEPLILCLVFNYDMFKSSYM